MSSYYQDLVRTHLLTIFSKNQLYTEEVYLMHSEKPFIISLSLEYGYIPVFGRQSGDYVSFSAIKMFLRC